MVINTKIPNRLHFNKLCNTFVLAMKSFKLNHQYSASAFDSLGDAYRQNGQFRLAKENYLQTITLAKNNESTHETYYQEQLASVIELAEK